MRKRKSSAHFDEMFDLKFGHAHNIWSQIKGLLYFRDSIFWNKSTKETLLIPNV